MTGSNPARESTLTVTHPAGQTVLHYPESGNMRERLAEVLSGNEYPIVPLPGYVPDVVVDVGANVGGSAVFFALNYPTARVLCYEPSPANAAYLRRNTSDLPRVETFAYGLSDRSETVKLYVGRAQAMQNSLFRSIETGGEYETAEVRKASDEFAARGVTHVSILKLDTEGCELPILSDLGDRVADVDLLYVEYHSDDDRRAIDALLAAHFILLYARANAAHRGTLLYLSRRLLERYPEFDAMKIDTRRGT